MGDPVINCASTVPCIATPKANLAESNQLKNYSLSPHILRKLEKSLFKPEEDAISTTLVIQRNNNFYEKVSAADKEIIIRQLLLHRGNDCSSGFELAKKNMLQQLGTTPMPLILEALGTNPNDSNFTRFLVDDLLSSFSAEVVGQSLSDNWDITPLFLSTLNQGIQDLNPQKDQFLKHENGSLVVSIGISQAAQPREYASVATDFISPVPTSYSQAEKVAYLYTYYFNFSELSLNLANRLKIAKTNISELQILSKAVLAVTNKIHKIYLEAETAKDISKSISYANELVKGFNTVKDALATGKSAVEVRQALQALKVLLERIP
jgi:hypothetical protein